MSLRARDVMQTAVRTVEPEMRLAELERAFVSARVSGFPVVEDGRLVGIVSRADVVRQLGVEQSVAEEASAFYDDPATPEDEALDQIAARVGRRLGDLRVADVMVRSPITLGPDSLVQEVARLFVERRIHRVPVVEGDRLVGIVSSLDLARLVAEGRLRPAG